MDRNIGNMLLGAKNLNAAIKKYLKTDALKGSSEEKFLKKLKSLQSLKNPDSFLNFIEKTEEDKLECLENLTRYAYSDLIDNLVEEIIEKHSEDFNKTYSAGVSEIKIEDEDSFVEIAKAVEKKIYTEIKNANIESADFMKDVISGSIYDGGILIEIRKRI